MSDIQRYRPVNGLYYDNQGSVVKWEDHQDEVNELKGIITGLQDVAAERVRPFKEIQKELEGE